MNPTYVFGKYGISEPSLGILEKFKGNSDDIHIEYCRGAMDNNDLWSLV